MPFNDPGAIATDVCLGTLTSSIVRTGTVNTAVLGSYTLRYDVSDGTKTASVSPISVMANRKMEDTWPRSWFGKMICNDA